MDKKAKFASKLLILIMSITILVGLAPTSAFAATVKKDTLAGWDYITDSTLPGNLAGKDDTHCILSVDDGAGEHIAYCLEIDRSVDDLDVVDPIATWGTLSSDEQNLLQLAITYGVNEKAGLYGFDFEVAYVATQIMVWVIVNHAYDGAKEIDAVEQLAGDGTNASAVIRAYSEIKTSMSTSRIPSFASESSTVTFSEWTFDSTSGFYTKTFVDTNNVLNDGWSVAAQPNDVTIEISGNSLTASSAKPYESGFTVTLQKESGGVVYWVGNEATMGSVQSMVTYAPAQANINAYFGIKASVYGQAKILKTTESKTGATDEDLAGHRFQITGNGIIPIDLETNAAGETVTVELNPGTYTFTETEASDPKYVLAPPQTIVVEAGHVYNLAFHNALKKGQIRVHKLREEAPGSSTTVNFSGVTFNIYDSDGVLVDSMITQSDGTAVSKMLYCGTYTVREETPAGYVRTRDIVVNLTEDGEIFDCGDVINRIYQAYLKVVKKDAETGAIIERAGAKFDLYSYDNGSPVYYGTYTTDATGSFRLPNMLPYGKYRLIEVTAPIGYCLSTTPVDFFVSRESQTSKRLILVEFKDYAVKGKVTVVKIGEQFTGVTQRTHAEYGTVYTPVFEKKPLSGVVFNVIADQDVFSPDNHAGNYIYHENEIVDTITTGTNGEAQSIELPLGAYRLEEVSTASGFVLAKDAEHFDLKYINQVTSVVYNTVTLSNTRQHIDPGFEKDMDLGIGKTQKPFEEVVFGIFAREGIKNDVGTVVIPKDGLVGLASPDKDGKASILKLDLPLGRFYLKELKAATGYKLNDKEYDFGYTDWPVGEPDVIQMSINNGEPIVNDIIVGKAKVKKTDPSGKALPGAVFQVYTESGVLVAQVESDANGETPTVELTYGRYYWIETKAPAGCKLDKTRRYFNATEDGVVITINVVNYYDSVNTGDNCTVTVWAGACMGSMLMLAIAYVYRKKRRIGADAQ